MILIPKLKNIIELGGTLQIVHTDINGKLIEERMYSNIVTTVGKNWIAQRMNATGVSANAEMSHMAIGGNSTLGTTITVPTTDVSNTVLTNLTGIAELARVGLTTAGGVVSGAVVTYAATFGAGVGTGALYAAGIFNASGAGAGTMLCDTTFNVVNKAANDSIAITWTVTIQ